MKEYIFNDPMTGNADTLTRICKRWRIWNNIPLSRIAEELDYTIDNIAKFEQGKNNNMTILLWYILHGFDITKITLVDKKEGDCDELATNS